MPPNHPPNHSPELILWSSVLVASGKTHEVCKKKPGWTQFYEDCGRKSGDQVLQQKLKILARDKHDTDIKGLL